MMDYSSLSNEELMKIAGMGGNQPLSVRNNNPGNLRPVGADKGFQSFNSPQDGMNAMQRDLEAKLSGNSNAMKSKFGAGYTPTIETIITTWAPPNENNTAAYINAVSKNSGIAPNQPLTIADASRIAPAMIKHEGGDKAANYYSSQMQPASMETQEIDYTALSDEELMKAAGIEIPKPAAPVNTKQGMQDAFNAKRINNVGAIMDRVQAGEQSKFGGGLAILGEGIGQQGENIANAAGEYVPDFVKEGFGYAAQKAGELGTSIGENIPQGAADAIANTSQSVKQGVDYLNQNYPAQMSELKGVGNLANTVLTSTGLGTGIAKGTELAVDGARKAAPIAGKVADKALTKLATTKYVLPNSEQLAEMTGKAYDAARNSGEVFDSKVSGGLVSAIEKAKPQKIAGAVETDLSQAIESGLGKYRELSGKPLTIDEIDIIDKDLSNLKDQAYNSGKNQLGSELSNIQNSLRASVADSPSGKTLDEARGLFRAKHQMEDIERIFRNAEGRPNEAAVIQSGFRRLANQARKKGSGYSKEQIKMMDKAAKGGLSIDALKLMSSKLIPAVAGATGNFAGAGAAYMGNIAAGAGATALQTAKANKLAESIAGGIKVEGEPTRINKSASALQKAFEAKKGNKP